MNSLALFSSLTHSYGVISAKIITFIKLCLRTRNWARLARHRLRLDGGATCKAYLRDGTTVRLRANGVDWGILDEVFINSVYQPALNYLSSIPSEACVFDCGANLGYFSLRAAASNRLLQVSAFEPGPPHIDLIKQHLLENPGLSPQIQVYPCAVGGHDQTLRWSFNEQNPGGSSLYDCSNEGIDVPVRSLASLVAETTLPIALAKIDIEGSEYELVRETPAAVWQRIAAVIIEVHNDPAGRETPADVLATLSHAGFRATTVHPSLFFLTRA